MIQDYTKKISKLTLMIASDCNLSCTYCPISNTKNNEWQQIVNEKTIESLKTGQYFNTVDETLNKLYVNKNGINSISIWGQEPTLILPYFNPEIKTMLNMFPNIDDFSFSSNGITNIDSIIDMIKIFNDCSTNKIKIKIQFSYDGIGINEITRNDNSIFLSNMKYLIKELNKIQLVNVRIKIVFHAVFSKSLAIQLTTEEKLKNYLSNSYDEIESIIILNQNKKIKIRNGLGWTHERPCFYSKEEGKQIYNLFNLSKKIYEESNSIINNMVEPLWLRHLLGFFGRRADNYSKFFIQSQGNVEEVLQNDNNEFYIKQLSKDMLCSANFHSLKIMYDGTIPLCHYFIFLTNNDFISNEHLCYNLNKYNHNYNPLKMNEEEIEQVLDLYKIIHTSTFYINFNSTINLIKYLAISEEIDSSYLNNEYKIYKHALLITFIHSSCPYVNIMKSSSYMLNDIDLIRFYCNGLADELEKEIIKIQEGI